MGEPYRHRLRVRYGECDREEIVFNAHYLAYIDIAMTELWRAAFGSYREMLARGVDMVVAEANLRFRAPARFDEEIDLIVSVTEMGNSSLSTRHEIRRDGELLVEGLMRHVFVDAEALRKIPIPDWARAGLARWMLEPVPEPS